RFVTVSIHEHDVSRAHNGLRRNLVRGGGTVRSEKQLLATKGPCCLFVGDFDIARRFQERIQHASGGGGFSHKNVSAEEVTEVPNPVRIEDRLAASHRQGVESADRTARVVLQIIEIRRVVTLVHTLHESEGNRTQLFATIKDTPE